MSISAERRVALRDVALGTAPDALEYDTLIVSGGSQYSYFGHDEWQEHAAELKSLEGALTIRRQILEAFEAAELEPDPDRRAELLTFVVVGAGPTGVEMAGQIAEIRRDLRGDFRSIDPRRRASCSSRRSIGSSRPSRPASPPRHCARWRTSGSPGGWASPWSRSTRAASPSSARTRRPSAFRRGPSSGPPA